MASVQAPESLTVTYCGHACFYISWQPAMGGKASVLFDPCTADIGCPPQVKADVVLISHHHFDHAALPPAGGRQVIKGLTEDGQWQRIQGKYGRLQISGIAAYHDQSLGGERGRNMMFLVTMPPFTVAHLGDLGHSLSADHINMLAGVDMLMIPVGGCYTIDSEMARKLIDRIQPKIAVPMHYKTDRTADWSISPVTDFLAGRTHRNCGPSLMITTDMLPEETEIWVFTDQ